MFIPGQAHSLHCSLSVDSPTHIEPPFCGRGSSQRLPRCRVPAPHVAEHEDHGSQSDHCPSISVVIAASSAINKVYAWFKQPPTKNSLLFCRTYNIHGPKCMHHRPIEIVRGIQRKCDLFNRQPNFPVHVCASLVTIHIAHDTGTIFYRSA